LTADAARSTVRSTDRSWSDSQVAVNRRGTERLARNSGARCRARAAVAAALLLADEEDEARASVRGRGLALPDPMLPLSPPLTVQLVNAGGQCWTSTDSDPAQRVGVERIALGHREEIAARREADGLWLGPGLASGTITSLVLGP
jgi:hypothetical protein